MFSFVCLILFNALTNNSSCGEPLDAEVNYFGQIADVVGPAGATPDTIFLLLVCTVADFSVIVFSLRAKNLSRGYVRFWYTKSTAQEKTGRS